MFAEELSSNASRKRQQENRARRRQLKNEKQKKPVVVTTGATTGAAATATATTVSTTPAAQPPTVVASTPADKPSAVAAALQQRQLRQASQLQEKASLQIQALVRAFLSNQRLLLLEGAALTQVLSDLGKLRTLLHQKTPDTPYVPPTATATVLARQLLFLTKKIPYKSTAGSSSIVIRTRDDTRRLHELLEYTILPGLRSDDDSLNPFLPWLQSVEGRWRLKSFLQLCLHVATDPHTSLDCVQSIASMLRLVLGVHHTTPPLLRETCQQWLIQDDSSPMDLIRTLRRFLLFTIGGSHPIPHTSISLREDCISKPERARADVLFQLVLEIITTNTTTTTQVLQARFLAELLSIPLLTWKVSAQSTAKLVSTSGQPSILLMELIQSFTNKFKGPMSQGEIATCLPTLDVPLTQCPATNTQCLLANLLALGRLSPTLNGSSNELNYKDAALFYRLVATLLEAVPLGTLVSRDSAVAWVTDGKGTHTPVVLSPVILDHCKLILVDSFVRNLCASAIDIKALNVEGVLTTKTEKDLQHERDLQETGSATAASLAAKDARNDRNRAWLSSKWANKLKKGVTSMLTSSNKGDTAASSSVEAHPSAKQRPPTATTTNKSGLLETSSVSMQLAKGQSKQSASGSISTYSPVLLFALCRVYAILLARWGGAGDMDIVANRSTSGKEERATSRPDPCTMALLNVLCFGTELVRATWAILQNDKSLIADLKSDKAKAGQSLRALNGRPSYILAKDGGDGAVLLYVFLAALSHTLIITDDAEIHELGRPLPLHQTRRVIQLLKKVVSRACNESSNTTSPFGLALVSASVKVMKSLYDRSARRPLCVPKMWLIDNLLVKEIGACKSRSDYVALLSNPVLRICPFLLAFKRRLKLFERIVTTCRIEIQGMNDMNPFNSNPLKPGIPVQIMRGRELEDGLATMNKLGRNLRERLNVIYVNEAGARESGIDAGGLFKEFWTDLCAIAFNPNYALFKVTEDAQNCLYPNPSSGAAHGAETHIVLFEFLGRILGKALFEGITVHPQFSHFFLSFLRGDYNYLHMLPDLSSVDAQLYNNLMFLKTYDGDAEDLCLTFTVANDDFGGNQQINLLPNGGNIEVTNANKQRYIGLVAKHYVVDRVKVQSEAFTRGLWDVIDKSWLRLFNEPELQVLISGATGGALDVDDMRANTRYIGGYTGIENSIRRFWSVVASLSTKQQADLLRFVTSCERPPPLGFASLNPPFTIQRVGIMRDGDRLPTASTCFNTLKLPTYSSEKVMKQRLVFAIESGAGFELS